MVLFRPVYIRTQPLRYEPPVVKAPPPKQPTPPPPRIPTPPPLPPVKEPPRIVREKPKKALTPILVCGYGVSAVYPKEATRDVMSGKVDYFLVDERGVTMFHKKHIFTALGLKKEVTEKVEDYPCVGAYERVLDRFPKKDLGYRTNYLPVIGGDTYAWNVK